MRLDPAWSWGPEVIIAGMGLEPYNPCKDLFHARGAREGESRVGGSVSVCSGPMHVSDCVKECCSSCGARASRMAMDSAAQPMVLLTMIRLTLREDGWMMEDEMSVLCAECPGTAP